MQKIIITAISATALLAAPTLAPTQAHAQSGNPLNSIFSCQASGNKQAGGAAVGAVLGGLLSNSTAGKRNRGTSTVLGAALGAAAGSYIGCRMQSSDQQKAEAAAQRALANGESTEWSNAETGTSGRYSLVSSSPYDDGRGSVQPGYGYGDNYGRPMTLRGVRFASRVQPQRTYLGAASQYQTDERVSMRASPNRRGEIVGRVNAGETFDVLARVTGERGGWLLVGRGDTAIGYVPEDLATPVQPSYAGNDRYDRENGDQRGQYSSRGQYDNRGQYGASASNQMCRTFDQTITTRGGETETNRYTACQTPDGQWVVRT
ncbi:SH3 domain-containing protein [soil metagenome]